LEKSKKLVFELEERLADQKQQLEEGFRKKEDELMGKIDELKDELATV